MDFESRTRRRAADGANGVTGASDGVQSVDGTPCGGRPPGSAAARGICVPPAPPQVSQGDYNHGASGGCPPRDPPAGGRRADAAAVASERADGRLPACLPRRRRRARRGVAGGNETRCSRARSRHAARHMRTARAALRAVGGGWAPSGPRAGCRCVRAPRRAIVPVDAPRWPLGRALGLFFACGERLCVDIQYSYRCGPAQSLSGSLTRSF